MPNKEAKARIKINKLLEEAGWRFLDDKNGPANISVEDHIKLEEIGDDFEGSKKGYIDFVLRDKNKFPLAVLEAKREGKNPLVGKEQARGYANSLGVRFIILSNGESHYLWDLARGNPALITKFPTQGSFEHKIDFTPDNEDLADEEVGEDYIALSQRHNFKEDPRYKDEKTREQFLQDEELRILRPYQLRAIEELQKAAANGKDKYLFEMATGTGKTLVSAAVIKLFLRTKCAKRVLFLVDRIELEDQAKKNFVKYLENDYTTLIYKENKDTWTMAEIVVSTVQSLSSQDKYKKLFSPTDFDLVISDEAHRSINGNSRAVFEYFVGYKLGLTATPKDYLKNVDMDKLSERDPRAWEKRQLLDSYITFGCENGEPTFRYSLLDGVNDGYLINPVVADGRTDITTELLSEKGYAVMVKTEEGEESEGTFFHRDFEKKFFSEKTNAVFCSTFLENALRDPISGEIGKTIFFCVSQNHALKIAQMLNEMVYKVWPEKYSSDFAVQVTSAVAGAQQHTINYSNNKLNGFTRWLPNYKSSRTRVCVTVGMMTTGYDCQDILNICLLRPIFSPTDFIQIKGRGTRKYTFKYKDEYGEIKSFEKKEFKLFDFFANYEYFEDDFDYDQELKLPVSSIIGGGGDEGTIVIDELEIFDPDKIKTFKETHVKAMKVDLEFFGEAIRQDTEINTAVENEEWDRAISIVRDKYEDKPELYINLDEIRKKEKLDRKLSWREVLEKIFGHIDAFKTMDEKLEDECDNFIAIYKPESKYVPLIKNYIKAYVADEKFREIVADKKFAELNVYQGFSFEEYKALDGWRDTIPDYVKDYIPLDSYVA